MEIRRVFPQQQRREAIHVVVVQEKSDDEKKNGAKADENTMLKALSPLLYSMRIFGLFFLNDNGSDANIKIRCLLPSFSNPSHVYAFAVLVAMWLNTIRLFTLFSSIDNPEYDIMWKCVVFVWTIMCTFAQTSCYRGCHRGKIQTMFRIFGKRLTPESLKLVRRNALLYTLIMWQCWVINVIFFAYVNISDNENVMNILLTPCTTLLHLSPKTLPALRCLYMLIHAYVTGASLFPIASNLLLAKIFFIEFNSCNRKFRQSIENFDSCKERFDDLRRQHQLLSRLVSKTDKFICFSNAAYVIGFIFLVIATLYELIWSSWLTSAPTILFLGIFWFSWSVLSLSLISYGGVIVNNSVSTRNLL